MEHCCSITSLQLGETLPGIAKDMDTMTFRVPLGVTAGITPFNFPAMIPLWVRDISISLSWWHYFELCYKYDTQRATLNPTLELKWKPYNIKSFCVFISLSSSVLSPIFLMNHINMSWITNFCKYSLCWCMTLRCDHAVIALYTVDRVDTSIYM